MKSHMFCADGFQNPVMHGAEGCRVEHFSGFRGREHIGIIRVLFVFFHQNLHGALRKCQQAQGVFRFWLADNKLMVDAADAFGNGKCSLLHVQIFPEQGQQFSPAQAAGQFQIERCKHAALLRFVQIWPDQFFRQHFHFFSHRFRGFAVCCRIAQNELFCDGLIETFPQDSEDTLHNAWAERRFFQRNVAVVVISAVLAHLVDRALNLNGAQLFQRAVTQRGKEMVFHAVAVELLRIRADLRLDKYLVPQRHPCLHGVLPRAGRVKLLAFFDRCFQLFFDFCLRFPENIFRDDLSVLVIPGGISALPASIFPFADAAFAVGSLFAHVNSSFSGSSHNYHKHSEIASTFCAQAHFCSVDCRFSQPRKFSRETTMRLPI